MYITRTIEKTLLNMSAAFPVLLLTGPRQVGKTTVLEHLAQEGRKRVSLDNPTMRALARTEPEIFLQRFAPPVFIDEAQYAPELFIHIKSYVDEHKRKGDFWLTGSQTFHLMNSATESLAGRIGIARMSGLSNSEINGKHFPAFTVDPDDLIRRSDDLASMNLNEVYERIFKGSMPQLYHESYVNREDFYESYLESYISRDVKDLAQVANEMSFLAFISIVAARTATNVNYDTLANEAGVSAPTAKHWLSILVTSGLVALIPAYSSNILKRVIKSPRMYFLDTGLCAYVTRWSSPATLEGGAMDGQFFETWVVSEIYKSYLHNGRRPPLFYYRDSNKKEIDLIIAQDGVVHPIEIKKSAAPKGATRHFGALLPLEQEPSPADIASGAAHIKTSVGMGAVICLAPTALPIDKRNWYVPAWLI